MDLVKEIVLLQRRVDGLIKPEVGRWVDWMPTVTQSGAVAVTVNYARYVVMANMVVGQARLTVTGSGTAGNAIIIGGMPVLDQPVRNGSNVDIMGSMLVLDSGLAFYHGALVAVGGADWRGIAHNLANYIGITPSFGLVATDVIGIEFAYERA